MLRYFPCCSDEVVFEVNLPRQVWNIADEQMQLSDQEEVSCAHLSNRNKFAGCLEIVPWPKPSCLVVVGDWHIPPQVTGGV